jgi:replication factor C large subunit
LKTLARRACWDLRAAITDFQILVDKDKKLSKESIDELSERERKENIMNALRLVLKTTDPNVAIKAFDSVEEDFDQCALWVDENLPAEYEKPEDLARAYDYLSKADIMNRRIKRWQHWRFLVYIKSYLTAGIAVSKDEKYKKFVPYRPTTRLLKLWRAKMKYHHTSTRRIVQDVLPYMQAAMKKNRKLCDELADEFELGKEEIAWLVK